MKWCSEITGMLLEVGGATFESFHFGSRVAPTRTSLSSFFVVFPWFWMSATGHADVGISLGWCASRCWGARLRAQKVCSPLWLALPISLGFCMARGLLPTDAELAGLTDVDSVLAWVGLSPPIWNQFWAPCRMFEFWLRFLRTR